MSGIPPTAANLRAEMARHKLSREAIQEVTGMHLNLLSAYVHEIKPLPYWAAHNIGYAINRTTGWNIFNVQMELGVVPPRWKREPRPAKI